LNKVEQTKRQKTIKRNQIYPHFQKIHWISLILELNNFTVLLKVLNANLFDLLHIKHMQKIGAVKKLLSNANSLRLEQYTV